MSHYSTTVQQRMLDLASGFSKDALAQVSSATGQTSVRNSPVSLLSLYKLVATTVYYYTANRNDVGIGRCSGGGEV